MKISYEFVTGEIVEIEVENTLGEIIVVIEKETQNTNRRETNKHQQISTLEEIGEEILDIKVDILEEITKKEENKKLNKAIETLSENQKNLLYQIFIEEKKVTHIAKEEKVSEAAIRCRLEKSYKKLRGIMNRM
ncbi:MAG: RNA polymerase sigma factor [Clostridium sp.]